MSSYWFFFSYARSDREGDLGAGDPVGKFYKDLCRRIALEPKSGPPNPPDHETGFFDLKTIQPGAPWEPKVEEALRTSRVLISLCSPAYFNSEYCGKEFQVFWDRQDEYIRCSAPADAPRVIQPILWGPPGEFPEIIRKIQYSNDDYPPIYASEGLQYMMRLDAHKDDYERFITKLGRRIVKAAEEHSLPQSPDRRPIERIESAFHRSAGPAAVHGGKSRATGSKSVRFVFVAASAKKFTSLQLKTAVHYYGEEGGRHWCPYLPEVTDSVGLLAQNAATKQKLYYDELPVDNDLLKELEQAHGRKELVIILLDPSTLRIQDYYEIMRSVGERTFFNCAVIVPWNELDSETTMLRDELDKILKDVFPIKVAFRKSIYYHDAITTSKDLKARLSKSLTEIRLKLIAEGEPTKKVENDQIVREARAKGIAVDSQPTLVGPVGNNS